MHQSGDGFIRRGGWGLWCAVLCEFQKVLLSAVCVFKPVFVSQRCEGVMMTHVGGVQHGGMV